MNKYKLKKREDIGIFLRLNGLKNKGIEVGSYTGEFSSIILDSWPGKLYMIDTWNSSEDSSYVDISKTSSHHMSLALDNVLKYDNRVIMIKCDSYNATELFLDNSLDFVYIDANHRYNNVKMDIDKWSDKVKLGGLVMGHDYLPPEWFNKIVLENKDGKNIDVWDSNSGIYQGSFGVNKAVEEYCERKNIEFFVTEEWYGTWYFYKNWEK